MEYQENYMTVIDCDKDTTHIYRLKKNEFKATAEEDSVDRIISFLENKGHNCLSNHYHNSQEFPLNFDKTSIEVLNKTIVALRGSLKNTIESYVLKHKELSIDMCQWCVIGEDKSNFYFDENDILFDGDSIEYSDICTDDLLFIVEKLEEDYGSND